MQRSPTSPVLSTSFILNHPPQRLQAKRADYNMQCKYELWVEIIEEIKQVVEFRQCSESDK